MADNNVGLIQIYTGDGKGKTTAAIGQVIRAAGHGFKCHVIHFMKAGSSSGEDQILQSIEPITTQKIGQNMLGRGKSDLGEVMKSFEPAAGAALKAVALDYDIVVLDEIITACSMGLVAESKVEEIMDVKSKGTELILTGRGASSSLIEKADLVTEMRAIKHPFSKGQQGRKGIEF